MNQPSLPDAPRQAQQTDRGLRIANEYDRLCSVIVDDAAELLPLSLAAALTRRLSSADALRIEREESYHPEADDWNVDGVRRQVRRFHQVLRERGVDLRFTASVPDAFLAFATRDVGFVVGDVFFVARRRDAVRRVEIDGLSAELRRFPKVVHLEEGYIEGGDVMVDLPAVYVGISDRTDVAGFKAFKRHAELMGLDVVAVELVEGTLHLDCCFNIIAPGLGLVQASRVHARSLNVLRSRFELYCLAEEDRATLASNVLVTAPSEVITDVRNRRLNEFLRSKGYVATELEFDEVTKLWGSFRCCVLPLARNSCSQPSDGESHVRSRAD